MESSSRNPAAGEPSAAAGWKISRVVRPSPLFGSNGMRLGPDGWLYVTQVFGSQITAINPATGEKKIISPRGGAIVSPDDLDFDSRGVMYVTEYLNSRVCARMPDGEVRVVSDQVPGANGITVHKDRLFIDECRTGGRLLELFPDGRAPRLMADGLAMPNACAVGPDGLLYFPEVLSGDIWRVPLDGGERERFISGMATPPALKFDNRGALIVLESHTGDVTRIDLQSRARSRVATIETGLDNLEIAPDDRIFVSSFAHGSVWEIAPNGEQKRARTKGPDWSVGTGVQRWQAVHRGRPQPDAPERRRRAGADRMGGRQGLPRHHARRVRRIRWDAVPDHHRRRSRELSSANACQRGAGERAGSSQWRRLFAARRRSSRWKAVAVGCVEIARAGEIKVIASGLNFPDRRCHRGRWRPVT